MIKQYITHISRGNLIVTCRFGQDVQQDEASFLVTCVVTYWPTQALQDDVVLVNKFHMARNDSSQMVDVVGSKYQRGLFAKSSVLRFVR